MRTYQKEILISIVAVLLLTLAIVSFFKAVSTGKSNEKEDVYRLVSPDVNAMLVVNRPAVFDRMVLGDKSFFATFAAEIPELFLSFIRNNRQMEWMVLSFHPQGTVCYIQAGSKVPAYIEKRLQQEYKAYPPLKQTNDGVEFTFYPDTDGRFFGYYVKDGVWVGSYSKRLLESTASRHAQQETSIPAEMRKLLKSFDVNAPLNIIFPTGNLDLRVSQDASSWQVQDKWLGADLFFSDGNFCCFGSLPYQLSVSQAMYKAMGERIAQQIRNLYPRISLSFEIDKDDDFVYYTGCTPLPDLY